MNDVTEESMIVIQESFIHIRSVVRFLDHDHSRNSKCCGSNKNIIDPNKTNIRDEEDEEENNSNQIIDTSKKPSNKSLIDRVSHLYSHFKEERAATEVDTCC